MVREPSGSLVVSLFAFFFNNTLCRDGVEQSYVTVAHSV